MTFLRQLASTANSAPGATTVTTASMTPMADGYGYLVAAAQVRGTSDPGTVAVTGWNSQTFTDIGTGASLLYVNSGTVRRRFQLFKCFTSGATAGALTLTYAGQPDTVDYFVIECGPTTSNVVRASNVQGSAVGDTITLNTLNEALVMNSLASVNNPILSIEVGNVAAATHRLELNADTNGDFDWTSVTNLTSSGGGRARSMAWGYREGKDASDLTVGWMASNNMTIFRTAVEIEMNSTAIGWWGLRNQ